jgi:hypothetical protein
MKFLDANIFIYAYYKPREKLTSQQKEMKDESKEIIRKINEGKEKVMTTVVHLSEISNILKKALSLDDLYSILITLYSLKNVKIMDVSREDYFGGIELMKEIGLDPNDSLAAQLMKNEGIREIYSFDRDFDRVKEIKRIHSLE